MTMRRVLATLIAFVLSASPIQAQFAPGARSAGMAGAGLLFAAGLDAVEWNPANLAWSDGWELSLYEFGTAGLLTGTSIDDLIEIATAGGSGDAGVINRMPAGGFSLFAATDGFVAVNAASIADLPQPGSPLPSVGLALGPFALRVRSRLVLEARMSREIADLMINGFNPERIQEYAVRSTGFRSTSLSEITLGYGKTVGEQLAFGVGLRLIQGHSLTQGRFFEPAVDLADETLAVTGAAVESPSGSGYAVDFGLSLDLGKGFRASLAAANLFQRMTWDDALVSHEAVFTDEDFESADIIDLVDRFSASDIDPQSLSLAVYEASRGLFDESYFPMTVRAGLGWTKGGTSLEVVGVAVSPRGRQHNSWDDRASVGLEQKLGFLTLRGGYTLADRGLTSVAAGVGFGLGPVALDVGAGRFSGELNGIDYDGAQVTLALAIRGGGR